jgi:hypothetical protein
VDREDWGYTYANLDSQTKVVFTKEEWYLKNQWFADTEGLELATMDVTVNGSASDPVIGVTVYRTFKDGTSIDRDTLFVFEDGVWKHRFGQEEIGFFMPEASFEEFVTAQEDSSPSLSASASAALTIRSAGSSWLVRPVSRWTRRRSAMPSTGSSSTPARCSWLMR